MPAFPVGGGGAGMVAPGVLVNPSTEFPLTFGGSVIDGCGAGAGGVVAGGV